MGLFSFLRRDPTARWPDAGRGPVALDLRAGTVGGVAMGAPWASLERLGRPASHRAPAGTFTYPLRGFEVDVSEGKVLAFGLVFRPAWTEVDSDPTFIPCRADVLLPGGERTVWTTETTADGVKADLGAPEHESVPGEDPGDEGGTRLVYALPRTMLSLEFDAEGRIVSVDVDPPAP